VPKGIHNKMADRPLLLNSVLCFLTCKFGKVAIKHLKSAVLDFYSVEELISAKRQLLNDARSLQSVDNIPHVPERRDGETRAIKVVDDIFVVYTFLDENLKLAELPKYVADSPDAMPSLRLYEGDLSSIMKLFERMEGRIQQSEASLSAIFKELQSIKVGSTSASTDWPSLPEPDTRCKQFSVQPQPLSAGNPSRMTQGSEIEANQSVSRTASDQLRGPLLRSGDDWAAAASSSPYTHVNRYAALATTDDERNDAASFTEHHSRRSAKRRRQRSSAQQQQQDNRSGRDASRRRPGQLLTGKSSSVSHGLAAAKKFVKRAVFCVDNVDPANGVDDVRAFVESLPVGVLSCFSAVPRRRRNEPLPIVDRRAFRLCIADSDRDRLLDASKWPDSVTISEWYHIPPSDERRQRGVASVPSVRANDAAAVEGTSSESVAVAAAAAATTIDDVQRPATSDEMQCDPDQTVLYFDDGGSQSTI